jgi:hypothetical protein
MSTRGIRMKTVTAVVSVLISILGAGPVFAQNYVGVMLGGYEKDCEVTHQGKTFPCVDRRQIYLGDIVTKKPSVTLLKIKWAPYVKGAVKTETSLEAASSRPEKLTGKMYAEAVKGYVADFVKPPEHAPIPLVTRGKKTGAQWPAHATLMQDFPLEIAGPDEGVTSVAIVDAQGRKVYEKRVKGREPVFLVPAEIGIKPLEACTVYVSKGPAKRKIGIVLMDAETQGEVLAGLGDIDAKKLPGPEGSIEKAVYLQLISDAFPDKIDLYWLANQLLEQNRDRFTDAQSDTLQELSRRCREHNKN